MKRDYGSVGTIALRASALLQAMSRDIEQQRKEFNLTEYHQTYTRNAVAKLPKLSRRIVELAMKEMEENCSGQQKLATALEFFQNNRSDSFGVRPPLY